MKRPVVYILMTALIISLAACTSKNDGSVSGPSAAVSGDNVSEGDLFFDMIPEADRELFKASPCTGQLPKNSSLSKVVLCRYNPPGNGRGIGTVIYAKLDLAAGKAVYGYSDGAVIDERSMQSCELKPDDIARYKNALNPDCLKYGIQGGSFWWRIALVYADGKSCYAYEIHEDAYLLDTPENIMVRAFFDRIDLAGEDGNRYGLILPADM